MTTSHTPPPHVIYYEPATLENALLPPLSHCWRDSLPRPRAFVADAATSWQPVADALSNFIA